VSVREPPDDGQSRRTAARLALGLAILVAAAGAIVLLAGPAAAGDRVALFELPESEQSASAGETVEIEVWLRSDGGYAGEGLASYEFVLAVPPAVGEPVDAEPGRFLDGGGGEVEQTTADAGPGALRIRHERVGAEDGTTGWERAATVTVALEPDAPPANADVLVADPDSSLANSQFPMRTFGANATLVVEGGGDRLDPEYDPADDGDSGGVNVTTAEETNRTVRTGENASGGSQEDGGSEESALPGFGVAAAALVLLGAAAIARRA